MDYKTIEKVFNKRISEIDNNENVIATAYRLYEHEIIQNNSDMQFDEAYYRTLVEATSPVIESLYEKQDEDGSFNGDIYDTSLFAALMCVVSRVYDVLDPIFARDCIHAGLDAAHFLMVSKVDMRLLEDDAKVAMFWAFTELSKTDVEIKNAYDHSMMAGMPQKMSRQKKYKMLVNELGRQIFTENVFNEYAKKAENSNFDLLMFSCRTILFDDEDVFSADILALTKDCILNAANNVMVNADDIAMDKQGIMLITAILSIRHILDKDNEIANGSEAQLIKVIEYNVINNTKKQLSDDEKQSLQNMLNSFTEKINELNR
ncbi:hypothetical protein [Butyrivibrio sp. AC2005]|uniref:hypothetical protein n=1 Tax=Butyrivibrio sp. AC2005 TaxID=1280672 RepID=UPI0003F508BA|nr:hypothetical protein [Butyrivibrio sp. AC2005]